MGYLFSSLINLLTDLMTSFLQSISSAVCSMLTLNIGNSKGFFELTFPDAPLFLRMFGYMAYALLIMNYIWQMTKVMMTPNGVDTPMGLTFRTVLAGMFMFMAPQLIRVTEDFFSVFYTYLLNIKTDVWSQNDEFFKLRNSLVGALAASNPVGQTSVAEGVQLYEKLTGDSSTGFQYADIGTMFMTLVFLVVIGYQYILYLIEVVERYVLLGILYYTSPLAFSMAGSKSTSNIFNSWIRMVMSQMFLMVCNVFFMRLFLSGMARYGEAFDALQSEYGNGTYGSNAITIVWFLVLYGVLYVGSRIDSYLSTLGLSAAQTGRGMAASIIVSARGVRSGISGIASAGKAVASLGSKVSEHSQRKAEQYRAKHQDAKRDNNGLFTENTMAAQSKGNLTPDALKQMYGREFKESLVRDFGAKNKNLRNALNDLNIVSADGRDANGGIKMKSRNDENGQKTVITGTPTRHLSPEYMKSHCGVIAERNGEKYFLQAEGPKAKSFYTAMENAGKLESQGYKQVEPGIWERVSGGKDGKPMHREVLMNSSMHQQPDSAISSLVPAGEYGDVPYWKAEYDTAVAWQDMNLKPEDRKSWICPDKERVENMLKFGYESDSSPSGFQNPTGEHQAPNLVQVEAPHYEAFGESVYAKMAPNIVSSQTDRVNSFNQYMPGLRNDVVDAVALPVGEDYSSGFSGNFLVTHSDGTQSLVYNTMTHMSNPQAVSGTDENYTYSSNNIAFGVVPVKEGATPQEINNLIVQRPERFHSTVLANPKSADIAQPKDLFINQYADVIGEAQRRTSSRSQNEKRGGKRS